MNIEAAATRLGELLEADTVQLPQTMRLYYLSQAQILLSRQYETSLNEGFIDYSWPADTGDLPLSTFNTTELTLDAVVGTIWLDPAGTNYPMASGSLMELLNEYGDSTGFPEAFAQHGGRLYIRPIPTQEWTLRIPYMGSAADATAGEGRWLKYVPWAVIYKAAEIACISIGQESRLQEFAAQRAEQIEAFNIADQSRHDVPSTAEDP